MELVDQVLGGMHQPVTIEDLTTFGLVNRVLERGENQLLFFTHQSFQEFLAAQHLASNPESIRLVLAERWHPKWREVIRFLSGLCGESIIQQVKSTRDNLIHADLFLAAHCLPEVKSISPDLKGSIQSELAALVYDSIFATEAMQLLGNLLEVTSLMPYLANSRREIRCIVIQTLAGLGALPAKVINQLVKQLKDDDWYVRKAAIEALARLGALPAEVVDQLVSRLKDGNSDVRGTAAEALAGLGTQMPAKAVDQFVKRLKGDDRYMGEVAAEALAGLGTQMPAEVIGKLGHYLQSNNAEVATTSYSVLKSLYQRGVTLPISKKAHCCATIVHFWLKLLLLF